MKNTPSPSAVERLQRAKTRADGGRVAMAEYRQAQLDAMEHTAELRRQRLSQAVRRNEGRNNK
jgi:hypothetical protein